MRADPLEYGLKQKSKAQAAGGMSCTV